MGVLAEIRNDNATRKSIRCLMIGLDNAGKSTVVAKFFKRDPYDVAPTVGFEINTVRIGEVTLDFWDVGGQSTLRQFWSNYFQIADVLIWVVDSTDESRMNLCHDELHSVLQEERLVGSDVLILCNKMDIRGGLQMEQIKRFLGVEKLIQQGRYVMVNSVSALMDTAETISAIILKFLNRTRSRMFPMTASLAEPNAEIQPNVEIQLNFLDTPEEYWQNVPFENQELSFISTMRSMLWKDDDPQKLQNAIHCNGFW